MSFSFTSGQQILIDEKRYWIGRFNERQQYQLEGEDGELLVKPLSELMTLYTDHRLTGVRPDQVRSLIDIQTPDLNELPDIEYFNKDEIESAVLKHNCICFILSRGEWNISPSYIEPLIEEFFLLHGRGKPCSRSTIYQAYRKYIASDGYWVAQLTRRHRKGNRRPRLQTEVSTLMRSMFESLYLSKQQHSLTFVHERLEERIYEINRYRAESEQLHVPNISTLHRLAKQYSKYEIARHRKGYIEAKRENPSGHRVERPTRPLERVEADHTPADVMLIDEVTGLPWGNPTITIAVDCYTGCILGLHISPAAPCLNSALACLRHVCLPKKNTPGPWPCYGVPHAFICDNGSEFHSVALQATLHSLGVDLPYCGSGQPREKGTVERVIGSLNTMFIHRLKGTTKSKYQDLGEYKPEEEAALTIQEFSARLYEWVCCIYHNTPDRVTGKTPLECWQQNIHISDIRLPSDYAAVERLVAKTTQLALSKGPLVLDGISYTSSELGDLRKVIGIGARVKVRYSDENLRFIEVINPITKQAFCVPAEDPHYTDGLSRHMHRLVRTHVRENYKAKKGSPDLMEARIALAKKIEEGVKGGKGLRRKMRLQAKAISSENPDGHSLLPQANSPTSAHSFKWKASSDVITGFGRE